MRHYIKFIKKFYLPLIALALISLIYFGINGVKAEFRNNQTEYQVIDTPLDRPINIVAVNDAQAQNIVNPTPSPTPDKKTTAEPSPEVKNIPAATDNPVAKKVTMRINAGSAAGNYPAKFIPSENAYQLLIRIAQDNHFNIQAKSYSFGMFVEGIGSLINNNDKSWFFYINGKIAEVGSSDYIIQPNDLIEWRYHEYWEY